MFCYLDSQDASRENEKRKQNKTENGNQIKLWESRN